MYTSVSKLVTARTAGGLRELRSAGRLHSVHLPAQLQVHEDDVGPDGADQLQGVDAGGGCADQAEVGMLGEDASERVEHQRVVVHHRHRDLHARQSIGWLG